MNTKQLKKLKRLLKLTYPKSMQMVGNTHCYTHPWLRYKVHQKVWKLYPHNKKHYYWSDLREFLKG